MSDNKTTVVYDNNTTAKSVTIKGEIVSRNKRHDAEWCNEIVTLQTESGKQFEIVMGPTYPHRKVKANGKVVGKWYVFA